MSGRRPPIQPPPLELSTFAYVAGIIDGEGCLRCNGRARLSVINTYRPLIIWLHATFGGCLMYRPEDRRLNTKAKFVWEIWGARLSGLLPVIRPYLRIKHEQADLMMRHFDGELTAAALFELLRPLNKKGINHDQRAGS